MARGTLQRVSEPCNAPQNPRTPCRAFGGSQNPRTRRRIFGRLAEPSLVPFEDSVKRWKLLRAAVGSKARAKVLWLSGRFCERGESSTGGWNVRRRSGRFCGPSGSSVARWKIQRGDPRLCGVLEDSVGRGEAFRGAPNLGERLKDSERRHRLLPGEIESPGRAEA